MRLPRLVGLCLALVLATSPAYADTFTLTGGFLSYYQGDLGAGRVIGDGLDVAGVTMGNGMSGAFPNQSVDFSGVYGFGGCGIATVQGVTYRGSDPFDACGGRIRVNATLNLTALPFVAPPLTDPATYFQTPFSLIGTVSGFSVAGAPLFALDVTGSGTIARSARAIASEPPQWLLDAPQVRISEPMTPNPEPSTLILFATAFGFACVAYRKRRA